MVDRTDIGYLLSSYERRSDRCCIPRSSLARYARDTAGHCRGTRLVMGNALVGRLLHSLLRSRRGHRDGLVAGEDRPAMPSGAVAAVPFWHRRASSREIGVNAALILAGGGFSRHAGTASRRAWNRRRAGPPLRRARTGARRTRPSRSARASASGISALRSGRRHRSGGAAMDRKRCSRISCSIAASRAPSWSTATAAASSTKRSPIIQFALEMLAQRPIGDPGISDRGCLGVVRKYGLGMVRPGGWGTSAAVADGYFTAETNDRAAWRSD